MLATFKVYFATSSVARTNGEPRRENVTGAVQSSRQKNENKRFVARIVYTHIVSERIMTKKEYAEYQRDAALALDGPTAVSSGYCPGCRECGNRLNDYGPFIEPWFSWNRCEVCRSPFGGERSSIHGLTEDNEIVHLNACMDCVYYIEHGRLDDYTMSKMED